MKDLRNKILNLLLILTLSVTGYSQDFIQLLENGDYENLSHHLDTEINIEFNRNKETLSKSKAIELLSSKMSDFKPVKWEKMHRGNSSDKEDDYIITKIYNSNNEGLRLFIHIEEISGEKKICSMRFRKLL